MVYVPTEHGWVSESFMRLAEVIKQYDPYLELRWIPPGKRTRADKKPYVVVDTRNNESIFYADETETPTEILRRLFMIDNKNGNVLSRIEAEDAARKVMEYKKQMDEMEQAMDETKFLMQTPLNTIRFNGKKLDDQLRVRGHVREKRIIT